jgi:hypothetical protein
VGEVDGGDHRIGHANGLAGTVEVTGDATSQLGGSLVEGNDLSVYDRGKKTGIRCPACFL